MFKIFGYKFLFLFLFLFFWFSKDFVGFKGSNVNDLYKMN